MAKFSTERRRLTAKANTLMFLGNLIGGGDDERVLKGQMPETWHTDPSLPLATYIF